MSFKKNVYVGVNKLLYHSFYIRAGKEQIYIKCFENDSWLRCSSSVGFDENNNVQRIKILAGSNRKQYSVSKNPALKIQNPFDHPRLVYNQFENAKAVIQYLVNYLRRLPPGNRWKMIKCIIFQLDYEPDGGISDIEKRMILDSLLNSRAVSAYVAKPSPIVSEGEIKQLYTAIVENLIANENHLETKFKNLLV